MKKLFALIAFGILIASTYIALSNSWITPRINIWQTKMMGDNSYFPVLTIFIIALPPLLLLLLLKFLLVKSSHKKS